MRLFTLLLLSFSLCAAPLAAQQPEYNFYRWSEKPAATTIPTNLDTLKPYCFFSHSQTEVTMGGGDGAQSGPEWHILLHQKIYFPGWQAMRALSKTKIPGMTLSMEARLYEPTGALIDSMTSHLLVDSEEPNGGIRFTGRMPGAVLEYIVISRVPFQAFFEYAWNHPVAAQASAQLIIPENFTSQYRAYFTQTTFERSVRDGKLFLTSRLPPMSADVFDESGAFGTYTPRLRYTVFPPGSTPKDLWGRVHQSVMTQMDETPLIPRGQKKPISADRVLRKAGVTKKTTVMWIPGMLQRHISKDPTLEKLTSYQRINLLHRCLAKVGIPHRFYFGSPAPAPPFDTTFTWFPDLNNLLVYLPVSGEWIPWHMMGIAKSPPDLYLGRTCLVMDANMPGKPSSGYRFESVPHPCDWGNEESSDLYWNGDSVMRFMRHYKGFPAREFTQYGSLEPELRSNLDIAIARSFAPDAWLLEAKAESLGSPVPEHMIFNGRFSSRSMVEFQDSVIYLHAGRFLGFTDTTDHPQWRSTPIDVLGRFSRVKNLYIQIPKGWELAEMPFKDTTFQYMSKSSSCPLQPDLYFTLRIEPAGKDQIRIYRGDSYLYSSYSGEGAAQFWQQSKMGNDLLPIALKFRKKR